jgi:hypothetical protein
VVRAVLTLSRHPLRPRQRPQRAVDVELGIPVLRRGTLKVETDEISIRIAENECPALLAETCLSSRFGHEIAQQRIDRTNHSEECARTAPVSATGRCRSAQRRPGPARRASMSNAPAAASAAVKWAPPSAVLIERAACGWRLRYGLLRKPTGRIVRMSLARVRRSVGDPGDAADRPNQARSVGR